MTPLHRIHADRARRTIVCLVMLAALWPPTPAAAQPYERAGWQAELQTIHHGVAGTVTILDEHTLWVDDFYYDGGGLSVFFWLDNPIYDDLVFGPGPLNEDFRIGPELVRQTPYEGESFMIDLGERSLDGHDGVSVWCVTAQVDFGHGAFSPPVPEPSTGALVALSGVAFGMRRRRGYA